MPSRGDVAAKFQGACAAGPEGMLTCAPCLDRLSASVALALPVIHPDLTGNQGRGLIGGGVGKNRGCLLAVVVMLAALVILVAIILGSHGLAGHPGPGPSPGGMGSTSAFPA
jgi:hypothetical protein